MTRIDEGRAAILDLGSEDYYHLADAAAYLPTGPTNDEAVRGTSAPDPRDAGRLHANVRHDAREIRPTRWEKRVVEPTARRRGCARRG